MSEVEQLISVHADKADRLIEAVRDLWRTGSSEQLSARALGAAAELSPSMIYCHFSDVERLYFAAQDNSSPPRRNGALHKRRCSPCLVRTCRAKLSAVLAQGGIDGFGPAVPSHGAIASGHRIGEENAMDYGTPGMEASNMAAPYLPHSVPVHDR